MGIMNKVILVHYRIIMGYLLTQVRQAAAYGCGVMGQFGGPGFSQWCSQAIPRLVQVIQAPNSREQENVNPTENAISAVTKILKWNQGAVNLDEILPVW